jgi:hypothetical protein
MKTMSGQEFTDHPLIVIPYFQRTPGYIHNEFMLDGFKVETRKKAEVLLAVKGQVYEIAVFDRLVQVRFDTIEQGR